MNTYILIAIIAVAAGAVVGLAIANFIKLPANGKINIIKNWLLYAIAEAEKDLGSGTGKLKLAQVYNRFVTECPQLANLITYQKFTELVDEVLADFKNILNSNKAIEAVINKGNE